MGLSSVTAVQLAAILSDRLTVSLPPTLLFDHLTAEAVVRYVEAQDLPGWGGDENMHSTDPEHRSVVPAPVASLMPLPHSNAFAGVGVHGLAPLLPMERRYRRNAMAIASTAGVSPSGESGSTG
jgi:hypothetical protein